MTQTTEDKIRDYIVRRYPIAEIKNLSNNDPLIGVLDSLAVLGLVGYIEPEFRIELRPSDLNDENFESIVTISRLVNRLSQAAG
jgi:acyl carrier protein